LAADAGIEWAFAANWTLRGEYLHLDLGHTDVVGTSLLTPINTIIYRFDYQIDTVRVGVNYKFDGLVIAKY
jgi:outer membrane immunogenic protein